MRLLRQSTAITLPMGPFISKTDGVTAQAALTTQAGRITKIGTGGAFAADTWNHDYNGMYLVGLTTTHTDTLGLLRIHFHDAATYLPVVEEYMVVPANIFTSWVAGSTYQLIDVKQWLTGTIPAVSVTGVPLVDAKYLLGTIFSTPATAGIVDVNIKNMNNVAATSITTINANQGSTQPINFTGTGATAYVKSDTINIASVVPGSATIGTVTNLTNSPTNGDLTATMKTAVQTACDAALIAENLDHLAKVATAGVDMTAEVVDGSIISRVISNSDTSLFVPATHSLQIMGPDIHGHVNTIDGHITADYGATEKAAVDLLDDANGLINIHDTVDLVKTKTDYLPAATAGTAGGVFIAGTNAATTITTALTTTFTGNLTGSVGSLASQAQTDVKSSMTSQGYTTTRAGYLDTLNGIVATIWNTLLSTLQTPVSIGKKLADWVIGTDNKIILSADTQTGVTIPTVTTVGTTTNLTNAATNGDLTAVMKTSVNTELDSALSDVGITSSRAGYLDKLNITGNVASSAEVVAIQNNTRVVKVVPSVIEKPDVGTQNYLIHIYLYDTTGNMEVPDSTPTVLLTNQTGASRTNRLDSTTMTLISTGHYKSVYTASSTDEIEQLLWEFTVVENGITKTIGDNSLIVDTTAVDFTTDDRTKVIALYNKLPNKAYLTGTINSDGAIELSTATGDLPTTVKNTIQDKCESAVTVVMGNTAIYSDGIVFITTPTPIPSQK
jgi:hypothetical protein